MVRIGAHATQSREALHGRRNTERVESTYVSQADIDYRDRVAGYRALIDEVLKSNRLWLASGRRSKTGAKS
jgi:hypothetical protein